MSALDPTRSVESWRPEVESICSLIEEIYPYCRSITGQGVRDTLARVAREIELEVHEVPTGTAVFDWEIPDEWNVRDAYVADAAGRRVIDFRQHNLHLMSYSVPVRARMSLEALRPHLHSRPDRPDWIPYRTSYWRRDWGFCLSHRLLETLGPGEYEVVVDSTLAPGSLTYAEFLVPGESSEEVLISTHVCHPSLANDNCSGIAVTARLAALLSASAPHLSYRFLFLPGTIGAVTWLARNEARLDRVRAGLVVGLLGDRGPLTYKRSRRGDSEIDRIAGAVIGELDLRGRSVAFSPYGYDERQFCAPGFDLAVGRLTRSPNDAYPEYHTSADNLELLDRGALAESLAALSRILGRIDSNRRYLNRSPKGEPRLGKRGLFRDLGGRSPAEVEHAILWLLNQSDGRHGLIDIAAASGISATVLEEAAHSLVEVGLLELIDAPATRRGARSMASGS
jgi:aminopeptidase-like protein